MVSIDTLAFSELRRRRSPPDHILIRRYEPSAKGISPATLASASSLSLSFVRFILEFACTLEPVRGAQGISASAICAPTDARYRPIPLSNSFVFTRLV